MQGILPDAKDWQVRLADSRLLAVGAHVYDGESFNLNCVLQKDANNGADSYVDFILVHQVIDAQNFMTEQTADTFLESFIAETNTKLAALNVKVEIPKKVLDRMLWHFRWSLSFDLASGKIVFKKP